jgi:ADP-ribose pyrophosphatase
MSSFQRLGGEAIYEGKFIVVRKDRFRHADGEEVERELVTHPGAVGIVAHDDAHVWLVRQPREAVGEDLLEIPAGKLDEEGEGPLQTARRELAEEIGKAAAHWEPLHSFYVTPGFASEELHLFLATGLSDARAEADENERIEIVPWPLADLDRAIAESRDSKSLIGLLLLRERLRAQG